MQRSVWKLPFTKYFFFSDKFKNREKKFIFFTGERSSTILRFFLEKRIRIHSGKSFMTLNINNARFIGHKLGEFSFTKVRGYDITKRSLLKKKAKS